MSHSTVLVIGPRTEEELVHALVPFDENLEVEPYVDDTRESLITRQREKHEHATQRLEEFLTNPAGYSGIHNTRHIQWIVKDAPAQAALTDDELWEQVVQPLYAPELDEQNRIWSTYNPRSRWDWYTIGGRWNGDLHVKDGVHVATPRGRPAAGAEAHTGGGVNFVERVSDLDLDKTPVTFAVLTPDGEWHERGHMGWFGLVSDEQNHDKWAAQWRALVGAHPDESAFLVDVHI